MWVCDRLATHASASSPVTLADHRKSGVATALALGFVPDETLHANAAELWRKIELPASNAHMSALGFRPRGSGGSFGFVDLETGSATHM
jgi:hypothetical protein